MGKQLKPVIVLGSGGHAAVLVDILKQQNRKIIAIVTPDTKKIRAVFDDIKVFLNDREILKFEPETISLVNGIGSMPGNRLRESIYQEFIDKGYRFETVISNSAEISPYATLEDGVQVMAGAIIQVGTTVSENCIINTSAVIDHDCKIGRHSHIAPSATLSGGVAAGDNVHIGTGANVIQLIRIGSEVVIGAGATITKNIESGKTVYPAKTFIR